MGFEKWKQKPPDFVIKAAMLEDGSKLREMASNGGKAAARKKAELKKALAGLAIDRDGNSIAPEEVRLPNESEQHYIMRRDAFRHGIEMPAPEED